ncbi:hypothetical protein GOV08_02540 [Candidatus Woesearchaeota archaeon]|nr:hypothetical protein [Candidatus Woesearchaeota archaeon]
MVEKRIFVEVNGESYRPLISMSACPQDDIGFENAVVVADMSEYPRFRDEIKLGSEKEYELSGVKSMSEGIEKMLSISTKRLKRAKELVIINELDYRILLAHPEYLNATFRWKYQLGILTSTRTSRILTQGEDMKFYRLKGFEDANGMGQLISVPDLESSFEPGVFEIRGNHAAKSIPNVNFAKESYSKMTVDGTRFGDIFTQGPEWYVDVRNPRLTRLDNGQRDLLVDVHRLKIK